MASKVLSATALRPPPFVTLPFEAQTYFTNKANDLDRDVMHGLIWDYKREQTATASNFDQVPQYPHLSDYGVNQDLTLPYRNLYIRV